MTVGLVLMAVFFLVMAIGTILLIVSVVRLVKKKTQRKGGLVAGIVITAVGLFLFIISGFLTMMGGIGTATLSRPEISEAAQDLATALEENDKEALYDMLAEESIEGDPVTKDDIDEMFEELGSDIDDEIEPNVYGYHSDTEIDTFEVNFGPVETKDGDKFYIYIVYAYDCKDEDQIGIQYITVREGKKKVFSAGTEPKFNNRQIDSDRNKGIRHAN